jgi:hypothetical protein
MSLNRVVARAAVCDIGSMIQPAKPAHTAPAFVSRAVASLSAAHAADQLTLALLALSVASAGSAAGSLLVAAHSAAWLLVSLPAGAVADRAGRGRLLRAGAGLTVLGAIAVLLIVWLTPPMRATADLGPAALATFVGASGVVLMALSLFALLPTAVPASGLPAANARFELGRAIVTLAAPALAGAALDRGLMVPAFGVVVLAASLALLAALCLPRLAETPLPTTGIGIAIRDGIRVVIADRYLRGIALCAVLWNAAFFALLGLFAAHALAAGGLGRGETGLAWSAYGGGLVLGALTASATISRLTPGFVFVFGPASSCFGVLLLVLAPGPLVLPASALAFFALGYGPMLWLIAQTSLRQIVTPPALMGRVGATITVAIYGVRPIGALAAGALAAVAGPSHALWLPAALFALSVAAILWSPLPALKAMPERQAAAKP